MSELSDFVNDALGERVIKGIELICPHCRHEWYDVIVFDSVKDSEETAAELKKVTSALDRALYELFKNGLSDTDAYKNGARLIDWKVEKEAG